jgi:hypothetical protein
MNAVSADCISKPSIFARQHAAKADRHTDAGDDEFQREKVETRQQSEKGADDDFADDEAHQQQGRRIGEKKVSVGATKAATATETASATRIRICGEPARSTCPAGP